MARHGRGAFFPGTDTFSVLTRKTAGETLILLKDSACRSDNKWEEPPQRQIDSDSNSEFKRSKPSELSPKAGQEHTKSTTSLPSRGPRSGDTRAIHRATGALKSPAFHNHRSSGGYCTTVTPSTPITATRSCSWGSPDLEICASPGRPSQVSSILESGFCCSARPRGSLRAGAFSL
jgi:hypothetical protein